MAAISFMLVDVSVNRSGAVTAPVMISFLDAMNSGGLLTASTAMSRPFFR